MTIEHTLPPSGWQTPARFAAFADDADFKRRFRASPALDRVTLALAAQLIDREKLGRGPAPDVLSVSLSATDYVGHRYGSEGPEMCQQLVEVDAALGGFLAKLAGMKLPVVVVLTADHGSIDAAERVAERGVPAQRFAAERVAREVGAGIQKALKPRFRSARGGRQPADDHQLRRSRSRAAPAPSRRPRSPASVPVPEVAAVFTRAEVLAAMPPKGKPADELTLAERFALSTDATRSGDIIVAYRPYVERRRPARRGRLCRRARQPVEL